VRARFCGLTCLPSDAALFKTAFEKGQKTNIALNSGISPEDLAKEAAEETKEESEEKKEDAEEKKEEDEAKKEGETEKKEDA